MRTGRSKTSQGDVSPVASARREDSEGYTLVALVVAITVMNVLVAAALQPWGNFMQREREQELIFRGLQYAEAIRVYQLRRGRLPAKLEDLLEEEPRCIRQLWTDPMTEDGEWDIITAQEPRALRDPTGRNRGRGQSLRDSGLGSRRDRDSGRLRDSGRETRGGELGLGGALAREVERVRATLGPVAGVKSKSRDESILVFNEQEQHDLWEFTADLLTVQAAVAGTDSPPRLTAAWIGRPFREGLSATQNPLGGTGPGGAGEQSLEDALRGNDSGRTGAVRNLDRNRDRDRGDS